MASEGSMIDRIRSIKDYQKAQKVYMMTTLEGESP